MKKELIIIAGSAGSLEVILEVLPHLELTIPPVVIVVHRKTDAESPLIELLGTRTQLIVKEIEEKEAILPGTIYVAPANYHLLFEQDHTFSLDASEKVNYSRPSIDVALSSAAGIYGKGLTAILLSGANADGTEGFRIIKAHGGTTIAQNPENAEISYMPEQPILKNLADHVYDIPAIITYINGCFSS